MKFIGKKVLHLSTVDRAGGAARAAYRLHEGLREYGVESKMLVQRKVTEDKDIIVDSGISKKLFHRLRKKLDKVPIYRYEKDDGVFSPNWVPDLMARKIRGLDPDVIHLHWIGRGFLRVETIAQFGVPIVWTLHDMWPFTGGCHYSGGCDRFVSMCGKCPQLNSGNKQDLSRKVWKRKQSTYYQADIHPVSPSNWLAACARESSLLGTREIRVIPNGINLTTYSPDLRSDIRDSLGIPENHRLLLFGGVSPTSDRRKGYHHLVEALKHLESKFDKQELTIAVFGQRHMSESSGNELPYNLVFTDFLPDDRLSSLFATADVIVVPSVEDNFPNVVIEGLASGTPCVAFDIGGLPDMIEHKQNGYLANPFDSADIAAGIAWSLQNHERLAELSERARETAVHNFGLEKVSHQYADFYDELIRR